MLAPPFSDCPVPGYAFWAVSLKGAGRAHSLAGGSEQTQAELPPGSGPGDCPPQAPALQAALPAPAERPRAGRAELGLRTSMEPC